MCVNVYVYELRWSVFFISKQWKASEDARLFLCKTVCRYSQCQLSSLPLNIGVNTTTCMRCNNAHWHHLCVSLDTSVTVVNDGGDSERGSGFVVMCAECHANEDTANDIATEPTEPILSVPLLASGEGINDINQEGDTDVFEALETPQEPDEPPPPENQPPQPNADPKVIDDSPLLGHEVRPHSTLIRPPVREKNGF